MDDRQKMMRASDADRQEVVDRLRTALDEGRLKMDEYLDRMGLASEAVTYGDLVPLYADLPESTSVARREPAAAPSAQSACAEAPPPAAASRHGFAGLPTPLKVLWTIWGAVVAVNVVIWALVSATTAQLIYPWPVWVAGPWGAILLAVSVGVTQVRRGEPQQKRLPPGPA
jgi:Domain of unknown function (DUF1707)